MTNWIQGVFVYIEKLWQFFYCFYDQMVARGLDFALGLYLGAVTMIAALIAVIPVPDVLNNFVWPSMPMPIQFAVYDLQIPFALSIVAAGASVRVTRWFLRMVL